jgi:hypothetical protein
MTGLICPRTGTFSFARVPQLKLDGLNFEPADVRLMKGKHVGPNRGFGAAHIFSEHKRDLERHNVFNLDDVPLFVQLIIRPNTPLHFEGGSYRASRLIAVASSVGIAVLEWKVTNSTPVWSVVTAYLRKAPIGHRVGKLSDA